MKTVETFIYVGGSLGLVGGHHRDPRLSFVRLSDYLELDAKVKRMAMDSLHDITEMADLKAENEELHKDYESLADEHTKLTERNKTLKAEVEEVVDDNIRLTQDNGGLKGERDRLKAEVERLTDAITRGASIPDAKPLEGDQK